MISDNLLILVLSIIAVGLLAFEHFESKKTDLEYYGLLKGYVGVWIITGLMFRWLG